MDDFYWNYIQRKYDAKLLFTDADSLVYEIKTNYVYEDFYKDQDLFDFIDYSKDSKLFDLVNKKVIAKMKDEFRGKIISQFVESKSKTYSLIDVDNEENKKAKGVNKNVNTNTRHREYIDVLFNKKIKWKEFRLNYIKLGSL